MMRRYVNPEMINYLFTIFTIIFSFAFANLGDVINGIIQVSISFVAP